MGGRGDKGKMGGGGKWEGNKLPWVGVNGVGTFSGVAGVGGVYVCFRFTPSSVLFPIPIDLPIYQITESRPPIWARTLSHCHRIHSQWLFDYLADLAVAVSRGQVFWVLNAYR
jgi:hypothetical protein